MDSLQAGSRVGPYHVIEKLGEGGMGEVYLADDTRLHRRVALKAVRTPHRHEAGLRRLKREGQAAARLAHPRIAAIHDVLEHNGSLLLVMEYVEGTPLSKVAATGSLPVEHVVDIGIQIAEAVAYAHDRGVVHRDIKPGNVIVTPDGTIKLLDLGLAQLTSPHDATATAGQTTSALIQGTPGYMSPEQLSGSTVDRRADIYSIGAVLFELLTGRVPFPGRDFLAQAAAINSGPAPRAIDLEPHVPPDLSAIVAQSLSREPADRPETAARLAGALRDVARQFGSSPTVSSQAVRETRPWSRLLVAIAATLILLASAIAMLWRPEPKTMKAGNHPKTVIAVLPVANTSGDLESESLGAGIASIVVSNLGKAPGVSVLSLGATAPYRDARFDTSRIARELDADGIVDLQLQRGQGDRLTLKAVLHHSDAGDPVWSSAFDGTALDVQRKLLQGLSAALEEAGAFSGQLSAAAREEIQRLPTSDAEALSDYSQARALMDRSDVPQNPDRAAALFESSARRDPQFALAYAGLADANVSRYAVQKDPKLAAQAVEAAETALRIDPNQAAVRRSLGAIKRLTGQTDQAIAEYRRALTLQPESDDTLRALGQALAAQGRHDEGIAELRKAIAVRPQYWNNHFTLGFVLFGAGRYMEAAEAYRRTTELNPTYGGAYQMLGTTLHKLGDTDGAIGHYEHAVRLGASAAAYSNLAYFYFSRNRYDDAIRTYAEAIARDPSAPTYHRNIADVYRRTGKTKEADAAYQSAIDKANHALRVNPRDAPLIALVALCEARLGRRNAAERHAAEAAALAPANRDVLGRAAQVLALIGEPSRALSTLERALRLGYELSPTDDEFDTLRGTPQFQALVKSHQLQRKAGDS